MTQGYLGLPLLSYTKDHTPFDPGDVFNLSFMIRRQAVHLPQWDLVSLRLAGDSRVSDLSGSHVGPGTHRQRFDVQNLLAWWIWRANEAGESIANDDLETYLSNSEIESLQALWVYGIELEEELEITPSIRLTPIENMPLSMDQERFSRSKNAFLEPIKMPQAALVSRVKIPRGITNTPTGKPNKIFATHQELSDVALLLNCCSHLVCISAYSTSYTPPSVPFGIFSGGGGGRGLYDVLPAAPRAFQAPEHGLVARLLDSYRRLPEKSQRRLARAINRLAQAKCRLSPSESALDLGIALEMVLLGDKHDGGGLPMQHSVQFRLRGSWLLGENGMARRTYFKKLGKIYSHRSQVAHTGFSQDLEKLGEKQRAVLDDHFQVAEQVLVALIERDFPVWDDLLLGAEGGSPTG